MIAHVVDRLAEVVDEVVVVASKKLALPDLPATIVRDRQPELGPLAGIREGLAAITAGRAFVTSTDAPFLSPELVRAMFAAGRAVATEIDGHVQTLAAVYPRSALGLAERLLAEQRMRPLFLLEALDYSRVDAADLPDIDSLRGLNTPEAYLAAVRQETPDATARLELLGQARMAFGRRDLSVPIGTLGEILATTRPALELVDGDQVGKPYLVSLGGRSFVRDTRIPVGPDEEVIVLDASVGG